MLARVTGLFFLTVGCCLGQMESVVTARLKAEFKETYAYVPPAPVDEEQEVSGEPVLVLDPMVVTRSLGFETDLLAEARRAAEIKQAAQFSLRRGGSLLTFKKGEIGFWPKLMTSDDIPVKKGTVGISVDLMRIKW